MSSLPLTFLPVCRRRKQMD